MDAEKTVELSLSAIIVTYNIYNITNGKTTIDDEHRNLIEVLLDYTAKYLL